LLQEYPTTHEVIVVNDNSVDESKYILEALQKTYKQLNPIELTQEAKMIAGKKYNGTNVDIWSCGVILLTRNHRDFGKVS
jgi:glycosyltransferase involved in cell wall biosynthesis